MEHAASPAGFVWSSVCLQESDVFYIPTSGLSGENLTVRSSVSQLTSWYSGPSLLEQIGNEQKENEIVSSPIKSLRKCRWLTPACVFSTNKHPHTPSDRENKQHNLHLHASTFLQSSARRLSILFSCCSESCGMFLWVRCNTEGNINAAITATSLFMLAAVRQFNALHCGRLHL